MNASKAKWEEGFLAGFLAAGEGYNGEYPFDFRPPVDDPHWLEMREKAYSAGKARPRRPEHVKTDISEE